MKHSLPCAIVLSALASGLTQAATLTFTFNPPGTGKVEVWVVGSAVVAVEDTDGDGTETFDVANGSTYSLYFYNISLAEPVRTVFRDGVALHNPPAVVLPPAFLVEGGVAAAGLTASADATYAISYVEPGPSGPEVPTGTFELNAPTDGTATPVTTATGTYRGSFGTRLFSFDVAADEQGKLVGLGTVEGVSASIDAPAGPSAKTQVLSPDLQFTGVLGTTKDGKAIAKLVAPLTGELDHREVKARFTSTGTFGDEGSLDQTISGSGQTGTVKVPVKDLAFPVAAPPESNAQTWGFDLVLSKETVRGKEVNMAEAVLTLPSGDQVSFPKRSVKYSSKKGYVLKLRKGVKLDSSGAPILDSRGKPVLDKKSTIQLTGMKLTKSGATWTVTSGTISYSFMGQKGSGNLTDFL